MPLKIRESPDDPGRRWGAQEATDPMTKYLQLFLAALLVAFAVTTTTVAVEQPTAQAQTADVCNSANVATYNAVACASFVAQCSAAPSLAGCAGVTNNFNAGIYASNVCAAQPGICTPQFCAAVPGACTGNFNTGQFNSQFCVSNPTACNAQTCAANPTLCYANTNLTNINTNAALIAQYCTANTATYNAQLCAQFGGQIQQVVGPPATLLVTTGKQNLTCGETTTIAVAVRSANNLPVAEGTSVTFSTNLGTLSSTSATTQAGLTSVTLNAGNTSGTAEVKATAGGASGSRQVNISCGAGTTSAPLSAPSVPLSSPPPPPPAGTSSFTITPPSTGDAGLLVTRTDE